MLISEKANQGLRTWKGKLPLMQFTQIDGASHVALVVKNPSTNAGEARDLGSIPGSGRFPGGGHANPLQYSCLENSMDRGAWQATVHRVTQSRAQVKRLSTQAPRKTGRAASPEEGTGQHRKGVGALRGVFSPASATASLDLHKTQSLALLGRGVTSSLFTTAGTAECLPSSHAPLVPCWYSALQSHG